MRFARVILLSTLLIPFDAASVESSDGTGSNPKHGFFGLAFNYPRSEEMMRLRVCGVIPEGPAEKAGLRLDDVIVSVDGRNDFESAYDVLLYLFEKDPGAPVDLDVRRGNEKLDVTITSREATKEEVERMLLNLRLAKQEKTSRVR